MFKCRSREGAARGSLYMLDRGFMPLGALLRHSRDFIGAPRTVAAMGAIVILLTYSRLADPAIAR